MSKKNKNNKKNSSLQKQILHLRTVIALRIMQSNIDLNPELVSKLVNQVVENEKQKIHKKIELGKLLNFALKIAFIPREAMKMTKYLPKMASKTFISHHNNKAA